MEKKRKKTHQIAYQEILLCEGHIFNVFPQVKIRYGVIKFA